MCSVQVSKVINRGKTTHKQGECTKSTMTGQCSPYVKCCRYSVCAADTTEQTMMPSQLSGVRNNLPLTYRKTKKPMS